VQLALNERGVQVMLDAFVHVRIHGFRIAFGPHWNQSNLVEYHLSARECVCNIFRS
jgi:hypothetical protein